MIKHLVWSQWEKLLLQKSSVSNISSDDIAVLLVVCIKFASLQYSYTLLHKFREWQFIHWSIHAIHIVCAFIWVKLVFNIHIYLFTLKSLEDFDKSVPINLLSASLEVWCGCFSTASCQSFTSISLTNSFLIGANSLSSFTLEPASANDVFSSARSVRTSKSCVLNEHTVKCHNWCYKRQI